MECPEINSLHQCLTASAPAGFLYIWNVLRHINGKSALPGCPGAGSCPAGTSAGPDLSRQHLQRAHWSGHSAHRYFRGISMLPSTPACVRLERSPALRVRPRHLTSPVSTGRGHTGAVTLPTGTSEAHSCSRAPINFPVGSTHHPYSHPQSMSPLQSASAKVHLERASYTQASLRHIDAPEHP